MKNGNWKRVIGPMVYVVKVTCASATSALRSCCPFDQNNISSSLHQYSSASPLSLIFYTLAYERDNMAKKDASRFSLVNTASCRYSEAETMSLAYRVPFDHKISKNGNKKKKTKKKHFYFLSKGLIYYLYVVCTVRTCRRGKAAVSYHPTRPTPSASRPPA